MSVKQQISKSELKFIQSRSSGPGGQHVNKVSSRVTLLFDVAGSPSLSSSQRQRILYKLANRINSEGILQLSSQAGRSQFANKQDVIARFFDILDQALKKQTVRRKTKISKAVKQRRLDQKKRHSRLKQQRGRKTDTDE